MKNKTINKIISLKINNWILSINDEELAKDLKNGIIVTGGCITSMLLNEEVNDFDVYFKTKELTKRVAQYYCDKWNERNAHKLTKINTSAKAWVLDGLDIYKWKNNDIELSSFAYGYKDMLYHPDMEWDSDNYMKGPSGMLLDTDEDRIKIIINSDGIAEDRDSTADECEYDIEKFIETSDSDVEILNELDNINIDDVENLENQQNLEKYRPIFLSENAITLSDKIQLIIRFYGEPDEIHDNYDFIHTTNYWTFKTGVVLNVDALTATLNKDLFYRGSKYPITSLIRTRKFIKRGWNISAGEYLKMAFQISKLNLDNIYVLNSQLVGVDSLYFMQFIEQMKKDIEEGKINKNEFKVDSTYVMTVIDKIFG